MPAFISKKVHIDPSTCRNPSSRGHATYILLNVLSKNTFIRSQAAELRRRLKEPRRFIQVVSGARQVGKTTMVLQVAERNQLPYHFASADEPTLHGNGWKR